QRVHVEPGQVRAQRPGDVRVTGPIGAQFQTFAAGGAQFDVDQPAFDGVDGVAVDAVDVAPADAVHAAGAVVAPDAARVGVESGGIGIHGRAAPVAAAGARRPALLDGDILFAAISYPRSGAAKGRRGPPMPGL